MIEEEKGLTQATIIVILAIVLVLIALSIFFSQADAFMKVLGMGANAP